jgi:glycosyltransferase A (GT-A) superfamily protein (DUF2064 family)
MLCDVWSAVSAESGVSAILALSESGVLPQTLHRAEIWQQGEGDLGDRLERLLRRALETCPAAFAVASDIPELTPRHIEDAVTKLDAHDAVLGPSPDGGYYLIGLKRCPEGLFSELPWSTHRTFDATYERLLNRGFSVAITTALRDVDEMDELAALRHSRACGTATRAWLERNG